MVAGGRALIDTTYVDNAADALVAAAEQLTATGPLAGRAFVVSNGEPLPVHVLLERICAAAGVPPPRRDLPLGVARLLAGAAERVWGRSRPAAEPPATRFLVDQLALAHWFDPRPFREATGWRPAVTVAEGMRGWRPSTVLFRTRSSPRRVRRFHRMRRGRAGAMLEVATGGCEMKATYHADPHAGLLLVFGDGARLDEWRPGAAEEVERFDFGTPMADSHELQGPAASHPRGSGERAPGTHSSPQRDLFERRLEQHRVAFVRDVAATATVVARERRWPLVLVLGDPHLTAPAAEVLRHGGVETEQSNRSSVEDPPRAGEGGRPRRGAGAARARRRCCELMRGLATFRRRSLPAALAAATRWRERSGGSASGRSAR